MVMQLENTKIKCGLDEFLEAVDRVKRTGVCQRNVPGKMDIHVDSSTYNHATGEYTHVCRCGLNERSTGISA